MNLDHRGLVLRGMLAAILGVWITPGIAQETPESEKVDPETIAALEAVDAGVRRWRDLLNIKCQFRFRQGLANSIEEAVAGQFPDGADSATCRFVKMGDAVLYDFQIEGKPDFNAKTKISTFSSFLLVTANNVEAYSARFNPRSPVNFTNLVNEKEENLIHRQLSLTLISPFVVMGANQGVLFQPLIDSNLYSFSTTRERGHLTITCKPSVGPARIFVVDTSGSFPVLQSIKEDDGNAVTIASEFVELKNGCLFPGRVVVTTGPVIPIGSQKERWVSRVWELDAAEVSEPKREDFAIDVDSNVQLAGLDPHQKRPVNFLDISVDLLEGTQPQASPTEPRCDPIESPKPGTTSSANTETSN